MYSLRKRDIRKTKEEQNILRSTSKYILDIVLYCILYVCFYLKHFICKEHIKILCTEKHNLYLYFIISRYDAANYTNALRHA